MVNPYGLSDQLGKNKWVTETERWRPFGSSSKPKCAHSENRRMIRSFWCSSLPTAGLPVVLGRLLHTHSQASLCSQQRAVPEPSLYPAACTCRTRLPGRKGCSRGLHEGLCPHHVPAPAVPVPKLRPAAGAPAGLSGAIGDPGPGLGLTPGTPARGGVSFPGACPTTRRWGTERSSPATGKAPTRPGPGQRWCRRAGSAP